jgi:hypothetical protein
MEAYWREVAKLRLLREEMEATIHEMIGFLDGLDAGREDVEDDTPCEIDHEDEPSLGSTEAVDQSHTWTANTRLDRRRTRHLRRRGRRRRRVWGGPRAGGDGMVSDPIPTDREEFLAHLGACERLLKRLSRPPRRPVTPDPLDMIGEIRKALERRAEGYREALRRLPVHECSRGGARRPASFMQKRGVGWGTHAYASEQQKGTYFGCSSYFASSFASPRSIPRSTICSMS